MNDIVVGLDAGGTKTRVLVATVGGKVLADVTGPGAVMTPGHAEHCADLLVTQIELALTSAEAQYKPRVLYVGIAGAGREAEQIALQEALANREIAEEVVVDTDANVAFTDAFGDGAGILLVAGSGSIAMGRSPSKVEARCGGWGLAFGDEGSGAWIGKRALSVVAAAHDGREPPTALTGAILTAAQVNEPEELIPWGIAADKEALAALAPSVMAVAMQEDLRANAIIDIAVEELILHVRALAKRLFLDERAAFSLALTGGLLIKGSLIRKRLERRLKSAVPGAAVRTEEVIGARGAVRLARLIVGIPADELLRDSLAIQDSQSDGAETAEDVTSAAAIGLELEDTELEDDDAEEAALAERGIMDDLGDGVSDDELEMDESGDESMEADTLDDEEIEDGILEGEEEDDDETDDPRISAEQDEEFYEEVEEDESDEIDDADDTEDDVGDTIKMEDDDSEIDAELDDSDSLESEEESVDPDNKEHALER